MKKHTTSFQFIGAVLLLALAIGCASTQVKSTEQMLAEAGFKRVTPSSDKQVQHLKTLPADRLSVAKVNGKTFYVFPDPAHNQLYVGNPEQYQTYQQAVTYNKLGGNNRVMADLGEDTSGDDAQWVEWTNNTGWTYGGD